MSDSEGKLRNLPIEIRNLVSDGIYSLYSVPSSAKFVLITDTRDSYLIGENGEVERKILGTESVELGNVVSLSKVTSARTLKINYA